MVNPAGATCGNKSEGLGRIVMTRDEIKTIFPDATDEQVTKLLNQNNSEVAIEKSKVAKLKEKANEADSLRVELEELKNKDLSEADLVAKQLEKANTKIAELEKTQAIALQKTTVAEKFKISAEQANTIVKEDGSLDYDALGKIITEKESAAAVAKEQEIAKGASTPSGGSGGNDNRSTAEVIAQKLFSNKSESKTDILSNYI